MNHEPRTLNLEPFPKGDTMNTPNSPTPNQEPGTAPVSSFKSPVSSPPQPDTLRRCSGQAENRDPGGPRLLDQLRREIRVRHYSIRTEHSYVEWVIRYVNFNDLRHPRDMGAPEISRFLSHLASDANVAASTQNQAA